MSRARLGSYALIAVILATGNACFHSRHPRATTAAPPQTPTAATASASVEADPDAGAPADCFLREDVKRLAFDFIQLAPPPAFSEVTHDYPDSSGLYPASGFVDGAIRSMDETAHTSASLYRFAKSYLLWTNRCVRMDGFTHNPNDCRNDSEHKGNYGENALKEQGGHTRPAFSTYARADECTIIQARRLLGAEPAALKKLADKVGLQLVDPANRASVAHMPRVTLSGPQGPQVYFQDVCILAPEPVATDVDGITLDYEVYDQRLPSETFVFLRRMKSVLDEYRKKLFLLTDDLAHGGAKSGIDASNIGDILDLVDIFAPVVWSGATPGRPQVELAEQHRRWGVVADLREQIDVLSAHGAAPITGAQRHKLVLAVSLFDLHLDEARQLHAALVDDGYRGFMMWRNSAETGGACSRPENQAISCLAFGACDKKFRAP